ncbi:MAG: aldehyde dehydrogenase family protein, partial [Bacteroidota bacterium]
MATTTLEKTRIAEVFAAQQANKMAVANTTAKERIAKLKRLMNTTLKYKQEIRDAMYKDFRKPPSEVDLTEIYVVTSEVKHAVSHLRKWMRPQRVATPISLMGSSSRIKYEPKGVCLIISPWNYPMQLAFGPLISAIAAGNTVIIKPSEHTPHTSVIMRTIIEECFEENEVAIFEGAVETSTELLSLPFNHIFFTGAPEIGKIVMAAAAKHLSSVTLELGGKSPTIVDETANLKAAATRIAWGKFSNNGQICIAPDYLFVHESKKDKFIELLTAKLNEFYEGDAQTSDSYCRIVNNNHFKRIKSYVDDSVSKGANLIHG